jgi:hypothetical protein
VEGDVLANGSATATEYGVRETEAKAIGHGLEHRYRWIRRPSPTDPWVDKDQLQLLGFTGSKRIHESYAA